MRMAEDQLLQIIVLVNSVVMIGVSLIIVYPVVAYSRNVAYTEGIVYLSLSFFAVTAITIADLHLGMEVLSDVLRLVAAIFAFLGTWYFSRDFIDVGGSDISSFGVEFDLGGDGDGDD